MVNVQQKHLKDLPRAGLKSGLAPDLLSDGECSLLAVMLQYPDVDLQPIEDLATVKAFDKRHMENILLQNTNNGLQAIGSDYEKDIFLRMSNVESNIRKALNWLMVNGLITLSTSTFVPPFSIRVVERSLSRLHGVVAGIPSIWVHVESPSKLGVIKKIPQSNLHTRKRNISVRSH